MSQSHPIQPVQPCIDFHFHSYYSNDAFSAPADYVKMAVARGVKAIAPTEHDNVNSLPHYRQAIDERKVPLSLFSGVEIDVSAEIRPHFHILGYFFDPKHKELNAIIDRETDAGMEQLHKVADQMNQDKWGIDIDAAFTAFQTEVPGRAVGPKAIWTWMVDTGKSPSFNEAKTTYQSYGKKVPNKHRSGDAKKAIDAIHDAKGIAVLAHPFHYGRSFTEEEILQLLKLGFDAVEIFHGKSTLDQILAIKNLADRHGWIMTGGSDNHDIMDDKSKKWPTTASADLLEGIFKAYEKRHGCQPKQA
jgi:3',5'-nucleoside bisphosphate phosphatase